MRQALLVAPAAPRSSVLEVRLALSPSSGPLLRPVPTPAPPPAGSGERSGGEPAGAASRYRSFFDAVNNGRVDGWAFDPAHPGVKLKIEVWCDGAFAALGVADLFRDDLLQAGLGDGYIHFSIPLPGRLFDGAEHAIGVRIAGDEAFGEIKTAFFPREALRITVEAVEGSTLRAVVASGVEAWRDVDLLIDNEKALSLTIAPNQRGPLDVQVPPATLDGAVHWFQFRNAEDGKLVGEFVAATSYVAMPEWALQRYARNFPALLSASAAHRYASLAQQISRASYYVARQAPGPDKLELAAYLDQIGLAHAQVQFGVSDRRGAPAPLTVPQHEAPRVSIVVPAHDKFWATYNCIAALILAPNETTSEIILVDDGSADRTAGIENIVKGVTVVRHEPAQGFIRASNRGAELARGEFVVMLNNDTEPCAGWLDELIDVFDRHPDAGLVGAKLVYPDGKLQEAGGIVFPNLEVWNYGRGKNPHDPRYSYIRQVDYCSGACLMLRREIWRELNGFDEVFTPAYYEDTDLAYRVRARGLKTYYTPFAEIIHYEGVSNGASTNAGVKRHQALNEPKFRARWAPTIRRLGGAIDPDLAKDRGIVLRALVIDAEPPQPDRDAGSYAAIQEMRLLQALGVKLTFVPENLAYLGNYTEALQRMGVEMLFTPFCASIEALIEERGAEFDFIYITRYSVAARFIDMIRRAAPRAKIVFCNADLHFLREVRAALASHDPAMLQKAAETREIELDVMTRVDVTLSYTDAEAAVIASHAMDRAKVMKCPWVAAPSARVAPFGGRRGLAFLGSYRHPPNEEAVIYFVTEILPELRQRLPDVVLHVYGSHITDRLKALGGDGVVMAGFVEDVAQVYDSARVFIAPLRSGAGIKGKVIGAMAAGLPSVVSPLAAEGVGISAGVEAAVAETKNEWIEAVVGLYHDERRWTEMSARARAFVANNFSFERGRERMRAALSRRRGSIPTRRRPAPESPSRRRCPCASPSSTPPARRT